MPEVPAIFMLYSHRHPVAVSPIASHATYSHLGMVCRIFWGAHVSIPKTTLAINVTVPSKLATFLLAE